MPIHQTKLRMSMPHATGTLTPHKPIPTNTRFVIVSNISWKSAKEIAKPKNHASDVFRFKTIELILSVTEANVRPGSITGDVECIGPSVYGLFASSCILDPSTDYANWFYLICVICGFGFFNWLKYVVRGFVFSSPSNE